MLEVNKLYNMDCLEGFKLIDDNSINLIVTSPPYNCDIDYDVYNDNKDWKEYLDWCRLWLNECYRVLKSDGRIAVNVLVDMGLNNNTVRVSPMAYFYSIMVKMGFKIRALPMWSDSNKSKLTAWGSWQSASAPYIYNPYEVVIIAYKKQWKRLNSGVDTISKEDFMKGTSGVWNINPETRGLTKANFPVALPKLCVELLSFRDDLVLDPFMGSGTTAVACINTFRNYIGFELSEDYHYKSMGRINSLGGA